MRFAHPLNKGRYLVIGFAVSFFSACMKDSVDQLTSLKGVSWNGTYALPLINAALAPEDALQFTDEFSSIGSYPDGQMYVTYAKNSFSIKGQDYYKPTSINNSFAYRLNAGEQQLLEGGSVVMERDQIIDWNHGGAFIDSIQFKSGKLRVEVENFIQHQLSITILILGTKTEGLLSKTLEVPWKGPGTKGGLEINLAGLLADLTRGPKGNNQFRVRIRAVYNKTSGGAINGTDPLNLNIIANDFTWTRAHGLFSEKNILSKTDDLRLGLLSSDFLSRGTKFRDARLKLKWQNTYALPLQLNVNSLGFIFGDGSRQLISGFAPSYQVPGANLNNQTLSAHTDSIYLNAANSNISNLVDAQPHYLFWNEAILVKSGSGSVKQTVWAESMCTFSVSLELPLYVASDEIILTGATDIKDAWKQELAKAEWINLRFQIKNQIPLSLQLQAYLLDAQNNILDSLIKPIQELFPSAYTDSLGNTVQDKEQLLDVRLDQTGLQRFIQAKRIHIKAVANTGNYLGKPLGLSKIIKGQQLFIKLGIQSSLNLQRKF